jgi:Hypothetical glycosyl hydrolase family 15
VPNLSWRHLAMILRKQWKAALAPLGLFAAIAVTLGTVGPSPTGPTAGTNTPAATPSPTTQPTPQLTPSPSASPSATAAPPTSTPGSTTAPRPKPVPRRVVPPRVVLPGLNGASTVGELAIDTGQDAYLGNTGRYAYVEINDYEYGRVAAIHAAKAGRVLLYAQTQTEGPNSCQYDARPSYGVSYCWANQYHPEWFLLNKSGQRAMYTDYALYMMDMGSPSYQQQWADSEIATAKRDGFDGVYMDDVNLSPGHGTDGTLAKYTDAQYEAAVQSFVAAVAPRLKAAGLIVSANVGNSNPWDTNALAESEQMARNLSIYNHEFWMRWQEGTPLMTGTEWLTSVQMMEAIEGTGTPFTALTYGSIGDITAMRYARASFLLAWNGRAGSALMYRPDPDLVDPYSPDWTTDVGTPAGNRYALGIGWRRQFSGGTVVVNPSAGGSQTIDLGGSYRMPDGSVVSTVTLGPASALVLPGA